MHAAKTLDFSRIAQDLQIRKVQVENVVQLLDEGNTIPFITRYRKERTGGLNEEMIRQIQLRVGLQRQLLDRKQTILKSIDNQGKLTAELRQAILSADTVKRLEDLYLPYKPKKRTLATAAREKGLEPLALAIWNRDPAIQNLGEILPSVVDPEKGLNTPDDVRAGVQHILAEMISEAADVRAAVRFVLWESGQLVSAKNEKVPPSKGAIFKDYFNFKEPVRKIPPHRILALNRGEREGVLKVKMEWNGDGVKDRAAYALAEFCRHQAETGQLPQASQPRAAVPASPVGEPAPAPEPSALLGEPAAPIEISAFSAAPPISEIPASPEGTAEVVAYTESAAAPAQEPPSVPETASMSAAPLPFPIVNEGEQLHPASDYRTPHAEFIHLVLEDALQRLILPSLEREIRRELMDEAEAHAVTVFARNLRALLLQRPIHNARVLAIDPGFRTGCKIAALDEYGNLLEHGIIYPHPLKKKDKKARGEKPPARASEAAPAAEGDAPAPAAHEEHLPAVGTTPTPEMAAEEMTPPPAAAPEPAAGSEGEAAAGVEAGPAAEQAAQPAEPAAGAAAASPQEESRQQRAEAKQALADMVRRHNLNVIALGNGTGCRETEELVAEVIQEQLPDASYVVVNEAGASVYSASGAGRDEFPDFDATLRGTISIGRRLQDPLAELVKIEPPHIGVGLYQHDVNPRNLRESLDGVVESCVNQVGVDLNTASAPLLRHVAGLNQLAAREIVDYRTQHGPFQNRQQLLQVPSIGPNRFVQAAGFLKIAQGENPLDMTWVHPESYDLANRLLGELGYDAGVLRDNTRKAEFDGKLKSLSAVDIARKLEAGEPTIRDIIETLLRPGRDPREDLPLPIFRKGVLQLEDLQPGMELKGTVLNVVDFGVFVDIGLKDSGLVHISQMANRFVKNPYDVVAVGDVVTVWVLKVDMERRHVSLTMIPPGSERKPQERRPQERPRTERQPRPPRPAPTDKGERTGPPPRGGAPGRGPRREGSTGPGPRREAAPTARTGRAGEATDRTPPPAKQFSPRKPRREPVKPKLTQEALEGKEPLRTFGELSALLAARQSKPEEPRKPRPERDKTSPEQQESAPASAPEIPPPASEIPPAAPEAPTEGQQPPASEPRTEQSDHAASEPAAGDGNGAAEKPADVPAESQPQ